MKKSKLIGIRKELEKDSICVILDESDDDEEDMKPNATAPEK